MKKILSAALSLIIVLTVIHLTSAAALAASGTCEQNLSWTLDSDGLLTISGTGAMDDFIGSSYPPWSDSKAAIKTIIIENGVTRIGRGAFSSCTSLTDVTIPDSVTSIGRNAFSSCSSLREIVIPDSVTVIDDSLFVYCSSLTSVTLPSGLKRIGHFMFDATALESITIPDSVMSIGDNAFRGTLISSVTLPGGLTELGQSAFQNCKSLKSITIPGGVKVINTQTFLSCEALESVTLSANLTEIGMNAFSGCVSLSTIDIPNTVKTLGSGAFHNTAFTSVTLPEGLTQLGNNSFAACAKLTSINIPSGVKSINTGAFMNCTALKSVAVQGSVTEICNYAFLGCTALTGISIPDSVKSIDSLAFSGSGLTSVIIPNSVTTIGDNAFRGTKLTSLTIPNSVTAIGDYAFSNTTLTGSVIIPANVKSIGAAPFARCSNLTDITVDAASPNYTSADGVLFNKNRTTIIQYPAGKSGSYSIPSGVTNIAGGAFAGCTQLDGITIPVGVVTIGSSAFSGCVLLEDISIPTGVITISSSAFSSCTSLISVIIPDGVTTLGSSAFAGCTSLASATIPASVTTFESAMYEGTNTFGNTAPGFTIFGIIGSRAHQHADDNKHNFTATGGGISINVPGTTDKPNIIVSGFASGNTVNIYLGNVMAAETVSDASYKYSYELTLPSEGSYVIKVETVSEGQTFTASKTIIYKEYKLPGPPDTMMQIKSYTHQDMSINLETDEINTPGITVKAYSLNGGGKWIKGALPTNAKKCAKLFDKGLELWLYYGADKKNKVPTKTADMEADKIVKFSKIEAREKKNSEKLAPYYGMENSKTWTLRTKGTFKEPAKVYQYAETSDGKTPKGSWLDIPEDGLSIPATKEAVKTLLFRVKPSIADGKIIPAGLVFKLKPSAFAKKPTYKPVTARKPTLTLKKGDFCTVTVDGRPILDSEGNIRIYGSKLAKTILNVKAAVDDLTTGNNISDGAKITVWKAANGKKPCSLELELTMPTITP